MVVEDQALKIWASSYTRCPVPSTVPREGKGHGTVKRSLRSSCFQIYRRYGSHRNKSKIFHEGEQAKGKNKTVVCTSPKTMRLKGPLKWGATSHSQRPAPMCVGIESRRDREIAIRPRQIYLERLISRNLRKRDKNHGNA